MKKRADKYKAKANENIFKLYKEIDGIFDLIAFLFIFRAKELLIAAIIALVVMNYYPRVMNWITKLF